MRRSSKTIGPLDTNSWVDAAMDVLAKKGIDAVRIEPLALKLKVTKGSFYHHFKDRPALYQAILSKWRQKATSQIISRLNNAQLGPQERLQELLNLPYSSKKANDGADIELSIRHWASRDPIAAAAVAEVDTHRLSYIEGAFQDMGESRESARVRAFLTYSSLLGSAMIRAAAAETLAKSSQAYLLRHP